MSSLVGWLPLLSADEWQYFTSWFILWVVLVAFVSTVLFRWLKLPRTPVTREFAARCVSWSHAVASVGFGSVVLYTIWTDPVRRQSFFSWHGCYSEVSSAAGRLNLLISASYFVVDTLCMLIVGPVSPLFLIHHALSLLCLVIPLSAFMGGRGADETSVTLLVMELSNPIMHGRWLAFRGRDLMDMWADEQRARRAIHRKHLPENLAAVQAVIASPTKYTSLGLTSDANGTATCGATTSVALETMTVTDDDKTAFIEFHKTKASPIKTSGVSRTLHDARLPHGVAKGLTALWILVFGLSRCVASPVMFAWLVLGPTTPLLVSIMGGGLMIVSLHFFINAVRCTLDEMDFDS